MNVYLTLSFNGSLINILLFRLCLHHFKYNGKRQIVRDQAPKKASTLPAKLPPPYSSGKMSVATDSYSGELYLQ